MMGFFKKLNVYLVLLFIGYLLIVIGTLYFYFLHRNLLEVNRDAIIISFFASLTEDIVFFGLVSIFIALAQFSRSGGESLHGRLQKLFANKSIDQELALYFINQLKSNSVYSEESIHTIEILEYEEKFDAYRISFENRYSLHNAFGDQKYEADMSVEIVPDIRRDDIDVPSQVLSIRTESEQETKNFVDGPIAISDEAFRQSIKVQLAPDSRLLYIAQWWSYASNVGESGFSVKRFSKHFKINILNRSNVTARFTHEGKVHALDYGQSVVIADLASVPERTRVFFHWLPPSEYPNEDSIGAAQDQGILEYDRNFNEEKQEEI